MNLLGAAALISALIGGAGSVALMLRARQQAPVFLLILFVLWVGAPFIALAWANLMSKRWPRPARVSLEAVTIAVAIASLAIYGRLIDIAPAGSPRAFIFVVVPPASILLIAAVMAFAALRSRRR